ncbi:MAG: DUF6502 family protein [Nitrospira sp.]|nr:DUF6502 family protein [Nitrospira sp.]
MTPSHAQALSEATRALLVPLVRIFLRNGKAAKSFYTLVKHVYIELAQREFGIHGKPATVSRIAILTGLTRKEVQAILARPTDKHHSIDEEYNRAVRVIGGWLKDPAFSDGRGHPAPLPLYGKRGSFEALVKAYSGDIPARAVLDELLRTGAVKRLKNGSVCLRSRGYVPQHSAPEKLRILGTDTADLIATIDHNIYEAPDRPLFQRKVMYDNVPLEAAKEFRAVAAARAQEFLEAMDRWLADRDRDVNPSSTGSGRVRTGIGIYHFEEIVEGVRIQSTPKRKPKGKSRP